MPVLTCPFITIPAQKIEAANIEFPEKTVFTTYLSIQPVADETWSIEGVSLQFTAEYKAFYLANIKEAYEKLSQARELAKEQSKHVQERLPQIEIIEAEWLLIAGIGGKNAKENAEASIGFRGAVAEHRAIEAEISAIGKEIESLSREISELGKQTAREGIRTPPLKMIAKLFARGNELLWTTQLSSQQYFTGGFFTFSTASQQYEGTWGETVNNHLQFDDPIDITERENLVLALEFTGPPALKTIEGSREGPQIGKLELSPIQAVVNYSRTMAGGRSE